MSLPIPSRIDAEISTASESPVDDAVLDVHAVSPGPYMPPSE